MIFRRDLVTISFESNSTRLLIVNNGQVRRWERFEAPDGLIEGGDVKHSVRMADYLTELFQEEELPKARIVSSVSGQRSIFRTLSLPPIEEAHLERAVQRKIRQEVPMRGQEMDFAFQVTHRDQNGVTAFVVATPRAVIDRHVEAFQSAGLRLQALDATPLALVRAANRRRAIVVGMEASGLTVVIVDDGVPAIVRTVPMGSQVTSADARLDLLIQELERTTKYFNQSHKQDPLLAQTALVTTGNYFSQEPMRERLAGRTDYMIADPAPPLELPQELPVPEFSVNLGLALKKV
ncbi:MAG: pilus assembly protein PilM [Anaerolineales bacterium]|nr:pilus assembly protein PilM [Anaerolineales bacterium]